MAINLKHEKDNSVYFLTQRHSFWEARAKLSQNIQKNHSYKALTTVANTLSDLFSTQTSTSAYTCASGFTT